MVFIYNGNETAHKVMMIMIFALLLAILNAEHNITADYLSYDRQNKTSHFMGNVEMKLNDGYITSDKAIHDEKNRKLSFTGNVKMEINRKYKINYLGGELVYETDNEKMTLTGIKQLELFISTNPIKLTSDNVELELKDYRIKTYENTKIESEEFILYADNILCDENEIITKKVKNRPLLEYKTLHLITANEIFFLNQKKEAHFRGDVEAILKID